MRAVLDTNVVVSTLVFGGRLAWLRAAWANGKVVPVVCRDTTRELLRVLAYPKFRLDEAARRALLEDYLPFCEIVTLPVPLPALPEPCRDRNDTVFLHLALAAGALLVTGDDLAAHRGKLPIEIVSAVEALLNF